MPEVFWIEIRQHYRALTDLLQFVDDNLAYLILMSSSCNMYTICVQLYNSFVAVEM